MRELTTENKKILETINSVMAAYNFDPLKFFSYGKNGAEYYGSCVRCHQLGGTYEAGTKHFKVWPDRAMVGELVFYCRECYKPLDPSTHWTGDLLQYLQDTMKITPYKAKELIGMDSIAFEKAARKPLAPTMSVHGAPNDAWQERGLSLVNECVENLWGPEGKAALHYLMHDRKLTEKTIREARLGYQPNPDLWIDAEEWGLDGNRLRIHRGIAIPSLHYAPNSRAIELWSINVRRTEQDVIAEAVERNVELKKVKRYMMVRGSENNVMYYESVVGKYAVTVEGAFNGLVIIQEGRGEFGAFVTQGTGGGQHDVLALSALSQSKGQLVSFDPDGAGREAAPHWLNVLENSIEHESENGDINDMFIAGNDIYEWLVEGKELLARAVLMVARSHATLDALEEADVALPIVPIQSIVESVTEAPTILSLGLNKCGYIDKVTGEVCELDKNDNHSHKKHHYCERCMKFAPDYRCDRNGFYWCDEHFMCWQLMESGILAGFPALFVQSGKGFMGIDVDCNRVYEEVVHCGVRAGLANYFNFCNTAHPGQISRADDEAIRMIRVNALKNYVAPVVVEEVEQPKKQLSIFEMARTIKKKEPEKCIFQYPTPRQNGEGKGSMIWGHCKNQREHGLFCNEHKSNADFMALGESFGYPSIQINQYITLDAGYDVWLDHCKSRDEFHLTGNNRPAKVYNPQIVPDIPVITALFKQYS